MFRSADLIFSLGIVGIAGVTLLLGVAGLGPQAVFWAAILIVAFSLTLMIDLDRWALFLCAAVVAVVAYSPAIGVEFEHLRYAIPIYTEMFLGVSLFEILLTVAAVLSIAAHLRSDRRIKITPLVGAVALFAFLTAIAFLRAEDPAGKTELRLLIPFFLAFIVGTFLPPRARTLTWFRFGILLAIVAAGIRSYLLVANSIGFQHGDYLRVSVDTGDFLFQSFGLIWVLGAAFVFGKRWALLLLPFILFPLLLSFARGAWVVATVAMGSVLVLSVFLGDQRLPRLVFALPVLIGAVLLIVVATDNASLMKNRMLTIFDWREDASNTYRMVETGNVMYAISDNFWWGQGLGGRYQPLQALRHSSHTPITTLVHNSFLWLALKGGLVLVTVFVTMVGMGLWTMGRRAVSGSSTELRLWFLAAFGLLFGYLAYSMAGALVQHVRDNVFIGLLLGFASAFWTSTERDKSL